MKRKIAAAAIFTFILLSCNKNQTDFSGITGKWQIAIDTTYVGVGLANHASVYHGTLTDYFKFGSDGRLTMREGSDVRMVSYTLTSDSTIDITSFIEGSESVRHCQLQLTPLTAIISTGFSYTPGGIFGRKVNLIR